ncbi:UNVERIFIED_CONTAM: hypothetical protein HDU68_012484 [Siphonaria sp. JEL0065]|nr:hypothetical protein HDU68_012484 [Siphonaria sp. JEL0065]
MKVIPVTIVTDTLCPWCYIGKKRFEKAAANFKLLKGDQVEFKITYEPYQLDSTLPKTGKPKMEHYYKKFGQARTEQIIPYMKQVGSQEGIQFSYGGTIGNSLDSHRLIRYAGTLPNGSDAQDKLVNALYKSYFEEEKSLADVQVLVDAAKVVGIDEKVVRDEIVGGDLLLKETLDAVENVRARGVRGVPHFTVGEKYEISGAEEPDNFIKVFEKCL